MTLSTRAPSDEARMWVQGCWTFPGTGAQMDRPPLLAEEICQEARLCPKCGALHTVLGPANRIGAFKQEQALPLTTEAELLCSVVVIGWQPERSRLLLWLLSYSVTAPCTWRSETNTLKLGRDFCGQRDWLNPGLVLMSKKRTLGWRAKSSGTCGKVGTEVLH